MMDKLMSDEEIDESMFDSSGKNLEKVFEQAKLANKQSQDIKTLKEALDWYEIMEPLEQQKEGGAYFHEVNDAIRKRNEAREILKGE